MVVQVIVRGPTVLMKALGLCKAHVDARSLAVLLSTCGCFCVGSSKEKRGYLCDLSLEGSGRVP